MAASEAEIGFGVIVKKGNADGPPETFTDFGLELTAVDGIGVSRDAVDVTHHQSPNNYRERIPGLNDSKPVNMTLNLVPADIQDIVDEVEGAKANWQIAFPDSSTVTMSGFFTDFTVGSLTVDGKMEATATFTPSGQPVWA